LDQDPIAKLDMTDPSWLDAFPLPVEDSQAKQLLDQLVKDAAAVRPHPSKSFATVQRDFSASVRDEIQNALLSSISRRGRLILNSKSALPVPGPIEQLQRQLDEFRSTQPHRKKLPETLWQAAVELARQYGVYSVAHPLRLDYMGLKKRLDGVPGSQRIGHCVRYES
jgi:hypothetical protein